MERIAIMGAGSLGTILGAYIAKGGKDITLVDANQEHVNALNEKGAKVIGFTEMTVPVHAVTPENMEGIYDVVLIMIKQTYNETAFKQLSSHINENTILCTLQNGLPEPAVCEAFGEERVLGAPVNWGATWIGPGVSECTSPEDHRGFTLGTVSGKITPAVDKVKQILECMCPVTVSDNLMGIRWTKVMINSTFSGMSTVIGGTFGDVFRNANSLYAVTHIGRECLRVAKAAGIKMHPHEGQDFNELFDWNTEEERKQAEKNYIESFTQAAALKASMLQDLEKGRKCEIDAINGVVCGMGKKYGVPTPANDLVVKIVKEIEAGNRKYQQSNADEFYAIK